MDCTVFSAQDALQLLGMEWSFRVVAPCPAPQKPHTPPRPTAGFRLNANETVTETSNCIDDAA